MSITDRDLSVLRNAIVDGESSLERFAQALGEAGLCVDACRPAVGADMADLRSTWAKRLGIPRRRPASVLIARKPQPADAPRRQR